MSSSDPSLSESSYSSEEETVIVRDVRRGRRAVWSIATFRAPSTKPDTDEDKQSTVHILRKSLSRLMISRDRSAARDASPSGSRPLSSVSSCSDSLSTEDVLAFHYPTDETFEAYIDNVKKIVNCICAVEELDAQTQNIVHAIMDSHDAAVRKREVNHWSQCLTRASVEGTQISRTIAVLAHDVLKNIDPCDAAEVHWGLQDALVDSAVALFHSNWIEVSEPTLSQDRLCIDNALDIKPPGENLSDSGNSSIGEDQERKLNSAAFIGDLFAVGILDFRRYCELVEQLTKHLVSITHCQALYLALLHAKAHIGMDLPRYWLRDCRKSLVRQDAFCALFSENDAAKRWSKAST